MRHKSRILAVLSVVCSLCMVLCLSGCSALPQLAPSSTQDTLPSQQVDDSNLVKSGTLTIGLDYSNAPFAGESEGRVVGIDADVGAALASQLGLKAEFVDVGTGGGPNAVATRKCDVFLSFDRADSTNSIASYAGTYLYDAASLFTVSSSASGEGAYTDASGSQIAAQKGRATAELVRSLYGDSSLVAEDTLVDAFSALENGSVQYAAASGVVGSYIATSYDDIQFYCPLENAHEVGAGVAQDNPTLGAKVSAALSTLSQNGTIDLVVSRWIGQPLNLRSTTVPTSAASTSASATDTTADTTSSDSTASSQSAASTADATSSAGGSTAQ